MNYDFIGWCQEDTHDKVWGVIRIQTNWAAPEYSWMLPENKYVTFWGRRGKKLQTKIWTGTSNDVQSLVDKKLEKGYNGVELSKLNEVYPEFEKDLSKTAVWATLKGV